MNVYMHPRLAITAFERLAKQQRTGVATDSRGNILLSRDHGAYRPSRSHDEIVQDFLGELLRIWKS